MVNADKVARRIAAVAMELRHQLKHDAMSADCRALLVQAGKDLDRAFQAVELAEKLAVIGAEAKAAGAASPESRIGAAYTGGSGEGSNTTRQRAECLPASPEAAGGGMGCQSPASAAPQSVPATRVQLADSKETG